MPIGLSQTVYAIEFEANIQDGIVKLLVEYAVLQNRNAKILFMV